MNSFDNFADRLAYFGAALNGDFKRFEVEYQDLELFILEASLSLSHDTRVTQAFMHWISRYGCLISPSKLRRLIQEDIPYDSAILGVILDVIQSSEGRLQSWKILKPHTKKVKGERTLFSHLPRSGIGLHAVFQRWGIVAPSMNEPEKKYLLPSLSAFKRCPELRYRAEGISPVAADIRAYMDKNPEPETSVYRIAKSVHQPRAQVNGFYRQLSKLSIIPA